MRRCQNWSLFSALEILYFSLSRYMLYHAYGLYRSHKYTACRVEYGNRFVQLSSALCYILCFWTKFLFFHFYLRHSNLYS